MTTRNLVNELRRLGDPTAAQGMARFGIKGSRVLGVSIPNLREIAGREGKSHTAALELWETAIHEARILASMIDDPEKVTDQQMEDWIKDFDSWDLVDQTCGNLFDKTPFAVTKALEWTRREREYEKRAGFSLMATLAVHDKQSDDETFLSFLPAILREARDERNFVKKAVNWSLRQVGKRNERLNRAAIDTAEKIRRIDSRAARWIATDALHELRSEPVQQKLRSSAKTAGRRRNRIR